MMILYLASKNNDTLSPGLQELLHIDFNLISPSLGTCTEVWQKYPRHLLDHSLVIIDIAFFLRTYRLG